MPGEIHVRAPPLAPDRSRMPVILSANSDWNIANFRSGLIDALRAADYEPVVVAPQDPAADKRMRELGVERIPVRISRSGLNPFTDFGLLRWYRGLLKRRRPALYISFTIKPNIYGAWAAGSLNIPAIPNVSGLGTAFIRPGPLQQLVAMLYRIGFRRAPAVFFQNADDLHLFVGRRIVRPEQARLLPGSGIDLGRFTPTPLPRDGPVFLLIGRLLRDKGVIEFLEAAQALRPVIPNSRFQLLGAVDEGNRTALKRSELSSWITSGVVEYLGETEDVRPFIAAATAIVLPSYREGMPRSLLEGAAMSRPLIATDVPGCRQVVEHGVNGYLCRARDAQSLASAMCQMAQLPRERQVAMGEAARRKVQQKFDERLVFSAYFDVIAEVNATRRPQ